MLSDFNLAYNFVLTLSKSSKDVTDKWMTHLMARKQGSLEMSACLTNCKTLAPFFYCVKVVLI